MCEDESSPGGCKSVGGPIIVRHVKIEVTSSYTLRTFHVARPGDGAWQKSDCQVLELHCSMLYSITSTSRKQSLNGFNE